MARLQLPNGVWVTINERGDIIQSDNPIVPTIYSNNQNQSQDEQVRQFIQQMTGKSSLSELDQFQRADVSAAIQKKFPGYGSTPQSTNQPLPDVAHKNDALFADLIKNSTATPDEKKIMQEYYSIVSKNDSDKALKLMQNFNFGLEYSDPIFKAKAAIATDALKQGLLGNTTDLAFREKQLTNTLNDLRANTEATKGYIDFTNTQELEKLARSYETDLNTVRDNAAAVGKTSSSVRSKAEQLLSDQNTGLVQSSNKQFTYQTGQQERNLASAETNYPLDLAQLKDEATRKRIAALRTAETDLGSYALGNLNLGLSGNDMLGNIPSDIGRQKIKDALSFDNSFF